MKKRVPARIAALVLALGCGLGHSGPGRATQYDVQFVGCIDSGVCYIGINPPLVGAMPAGCTRRDQVRFKLGTVGGEALYKLALSAFLSGLKLDVTHHLSTNTCIDEFAAVWYLGPTK